MAARPTNRIKATCWTPTMKMDMDGTIVGVIAQLFWAVDGKEMRKKLAEALEAVDKKMTAAEEVRALPAVLA